MNKKYQITESQMKRIISHVKQGGRQEVIKEGWIHNIATVVGLLTSVAGVGQTVQDLPYSDDTKNQIETALENPQVIAKLKDMGFTDNNVKRAHDRLKGEKTGRVKHVDVLGDDDLVKYLKLGYHLTSTQTDTVINIIQTIAPDTIVSETILEFRDNAFFGSGAFTLGEGEIKTALSEIDSSGNVLLSVIVESSTDKQGLSKNLQRTLLSLGYTGDNNGLSQARNHAVMKVLNGEGVDSSLIGQEILFEKGEGDINQSTRYVKVRLQVLEVSSMSFPGEEEIIKSFPETHSLVKVYKKYKPRKKRQPPVKKNMCKIKIKSFKRGKWICPEAF